jgi:CheY-like chemotaxis protein
MDHMMPYMDGTETMLTLREIGYFQPIIVLTANAIMGQAEIFMQQGFDGYLSKPIQPKQLDFFLNKYIRDKQTPEVLADAEKKRKKHFDTKDLHDFQSNPELLKKLRTDFAIEQKNVIKELRRAISENDKKQAHLLVHTLKGRSALIHENTLADIAESVEQVIKSGAFPSTNSLSVMEYELGNVINEILPVGKATKTLAILDELQPLLEQRKTSSRNALGKLYDLPEAAILVRQVEKYDFAAALKSMKILRLIMEEGK